MNQIQMVFLIFFSILGKMGHVANGDLVDLDDKAKELSNLLGPAFNGEPPDVIYLNGDAATGKTALVRKSLQQADFSYAFVNCVESYSVKQLFENIANQLAGHVLSSRNSYQPYSSCGSMMDFLDALHRLSAEKRIGLPNEKSILIVLDNCEKLRNLNKNLCSGFFKLRELSGLKICVIFVSHIPWSHFNSNEFVTQPITITLPQYDQKQLHNILEKTKPSQVSQQFYNNFVSLFLSIFYSATHDVRELDYQIKKSFEYYYKPVLNGELREEDSSQLWKRSNAHFKKALRSLYLKVDCNMEQSEIESLTSVSTQALIMELPFYSKYILIAAYIASYNAASHDKRLFEKMSTKQKKSGRTKAETAKQHLLGPKPFGLQRLFAITSSILDDEKFTLNADIFVEVRNNYLIW